MWSYFVLLSLIGLFHQGQSTSNDQANGLFVDSSFQNPSAHVRPRFRYWLPDASVSKSKIQEDIKAAGSIGAGGVEFLSFYNYGGHLDSTPGTNWSTYAFGTPPFNELFVTALQAHKEAGLVMDFAVGPNQGQGVPAKIDDQGLQWDLHPSFMTVPDNGIFDAVPNGWGSGELVALISAELISSRNETSYQLLVLKSGTLEDQTNQVSKNGHVLLNFESHKTHVLFAFYQSQTLEQNVYFPSSVHNTIWDNGSFTVDHFSARGAETVIKFWEEHILPSGVDDLLSQSANETNTCEGWEDSIEITWNISWTPSLPQTFKARHGYPLEPYLPLIMFGNNNIAQQSSDPGLIQCVLDTADRGIGYVNDFRQSLEDGYREYLVQYSEWLKSRLNLQMSAQVSYNLPMNMLKNIPYTDVPECESLGFNNNIDAYRQYSGPALLSGKKIISNEMGAERLQAFRYHFIDLLWSINRAAAGGINQVVLHGQTYSGNYTGTTWPGYVPFSYIFSEIYSQKHPAWDHGFSDVLNYVARLQYAQQHGQPKADIAIYYETSATETAIPTKYTSSDLIDKGFSYYYLTEDNLNLPQATIKGGNLAPQGPAFKAFVLDSAVGNMTLTAVKRMQGYAKAGLPIIIASDDLGYYASRDSRDKQAVLQEIYSLKKMRNVYTVARGQVANQLANIGITPQIQVQTNGTWYTTWREGSDGTDFAFILCDMTASQGQISVATTKTPILYDPWTGGHKHFLQYWRDGERTVIPLQLAGNQTIVIGFGNKARNSHTHAIQLPTNVLGYIYSDENGYQLQIGTGYSSRPLILSNGRKIQIPTNPAPSPVFKLMNWTLTAEHWEAPRDIYDPSVSAVKYNTTHELPALVSWTDIPQLANTSGIGYYETTFDWPITRDSQDKGAFITLPIVPHGARVYMNGHRVPAFDYNAPKSDIGSYLVLGKNKVLIEVPTTMWNYLLSIMPELRTAGNAPLLLTYFRDQIPGTQANGLVGSVDITPYVSYDLH
ncbi:Multicopy suppressor of chk1 protein 1 [Talaromyces islandicus]|uniref:Multicopy suppressor of chk1 protein 1 n=1 Tax=Talaromyces islandicus TaxID=28573 RepID=A0A0U1M5Z1_TALIS|nr:Multicopy suppressor of chk1 protein 1 [Talaromyces islandicus]